MSWRATSVVVVEDAGLTASMFPDTSTDCLASASPSWKCRTGALPAATTRACSIGAKPSRATFTRYSPTGTAENSNAPSESVAPVRW